MHGAWRKIAVVDLSNRNVHTEEVDEALYKKYFSGSGFAAYMLYHERKYAVEPLGRENDVMIMTGLLTGTPVYTACKTSICARSPLTGIWGESTLGGYWGATLRSAGYDGIWIKGIASSPSYLWVTSDRIEIRDAASTWGMNTFETEVILRRETNAKAKVLCIGRAGEKLTRIASLIAEGMKSRAAGRTGLGAVMGSKKLKAVVVGGEKKLSIYDSSGLKQSLNDFMPLIKKFSANMSKFGTAAVVMSKELIGGLPIRNFSLGMRWEKGAEKISGQTLVQSIRHKDYGCFCCPIRCGKEVSIPSGPYAGLIGHGPEYETIAGFGSNLLIDDLETIVTANYLCNDYGLDTISTSVTLGFAFEAFERGLLKSSDCDGMELTWGNKKSILDLIRKIGEREGIGALLADGSRAAECKINGTSEEIATHAKGLEPSTTMPTPTVSLALSWATSNRGACHLEGFSHVVEGGVPFNEVGYGNYVDPLTNEGKGRLVKVMQDFMATFNATGLCKFLFSSRLRPARMAEWINLVTGWELRAEEIMATGERVYNMKRMYNIGAGVSRTDDRISPKLLKILRRGGSIEETAAFFEEMLIEYYRERGWDEKGIPKNETLRRLALIL